MESKIRTISRQAIPPDGTYSGTWGGNVVTFEADGVVYSATAEDAIRTPAARCVVAVSGGVAKAEISQ